MAVQPSLVEQVLLCRVRCGTGFSPTSSSCKEGDGWCGLQQEDLHTVAWNRSFVSKTFLVL